MLKNASKEAATKHRVSCAVGCVDGIITLKALTQWAATRRVSLKPVLRILCCLCSSQEVNRTSHQAGLFLSGLLSLLSKFTPGRKHFIPSERNVVHPNTASRNSLHLNDFHSN